MILNNDEVIAWLDSLEKDSKALKREIMQLCWYMRGSITYDDSMMLSYDDRRIISKIIEENLETTEKSGLPFF